MGNIRKSTFAKMNEKRTPFLNAQTHESDNAVRQPVTVDATSFEVFVEDSGIYQFDLKDKKSVFSRFSIKKGCLYKGFKKIGKIKFIRVRF